MKKEKESFFFVFSVNSVFYFNFFSISSFVELELFRGDEMEILEYCLKKNGGW